MANLRSHILAGDGQVVAAVALTAKPYSAILTPTQEQLDELRKRHGKYFEKWWREHFGHTFDCLTQSEARYLSHSQDADEIRNRIAEAKRTGSGAGNTRSPGEQERHLAHLKSRLAEQHPHGAPASLRPEPGLWQGYASPARITEPELPGSIFDSRLLVLSISGKRLPLPATLKLPVREIVRGKWA